MSRVGWSSSDSPDLVFRPVLGRTRKEKGKNGTELLVANDIANVETVRFNLKTPFDRNVVTQGDYQVTLHGLSQLTVPRYHRLFPSAGNDPGLRIPPSGARRRWRAAPRRRD